MLIIIHKPSGLRSMATAACCLLLLALAGAAAAREDPLSSVTSWHKPTVAEVASSSSSSSNNKGTIPQNLQHPLLGADAAASGSEAAFSASDDELLEVLQASLVDAVPGTSEPARTLLGMHAPPKPNSKCIQYAKEVNNRAKQGQKLLVVNSPMPGRCPQNCRAGLQRQVPDGVYKVTCNVSNCKCTFVSDSNKKHSGVRMNDNAGLLTQKVVKGCAVKACAGVYAFCKQC